MLYPSIKEYIESINNASENLDNLSYLSPVRNENGEVIMSSGNFAVVFKMQDREGKQYALKCFLREQEGRSESYRKIIDELEFISSPYMVKMEYFDNELFVDSNTSSESEFPVLLMDWVDGVTIDRYVRENINYQYALDMLCYDFCKLSSWLMSQPFAHGDLKPDNILVKDDGSLVLVDYDGMYVPSMQGEHSRELGSPDYRHPLRSVEVFNSNIDDFALALISLTLKLISKNPKYIQEKDCNEALLFNENDFRDLSDSIIPEYVSEYLSDPEVVKLYSLFLMCHSYGDLSLASFRLFKLQRPQMPEYLELSTVVTDDDLANCITDEYGVKYSQDGLRLLKCENKDLRSYKIRRGCRVICADAFYRCTSLESVVIPESVTEIGECTFKGCTSLKSIVIPESVTEIESWAFYGCTSLESVVIPESVTEIGGGAFYGCTSLESVVIPESVTEIGYAAFKDCTSLESLVIPESVTEIGISAFLNCTSLESVVIPESVTEMGGGAFGGCTSLESVVIPESVTEIGYAAFSGCTSLESVVIPESVTEIGHFAFSGCTSLENIYIPKGSTGKFKKMLDSNLWDKLIEV